MPELLNINRVASIVVSSPCSQFDDPTISSMAKMKVNPNELLTARQ